jgi:hypothetical protein
MSGTLAAAQTSTTPRIDGEGINMDAPPPPMREPSHPADGYAPKASNPFAATTGQAPKDDRFPADRGDIAYSVGPKTLMDGEGARGPITDDHPVPTNLTSKIVSNGQTSDVTMVLDEGSVKELAATPLSSSGRVPVTEANRQGIIDPLTAMLFWAVAPGALSQETCRRTLPIFDGHQRYDLKLAFKRMDKVTAEKGYAGPVVVCSLRYEPIVGHISSNALVKYLSEGREMEVALAPVAGTRLLAPFRLSVVSMLANLVIEASQFEAIARPADAATVAAPKAQ